MHSSGEWLAACASLRRPLTKTSAGAEVAGCCSSLNLSVVALCCTCHCSCAQPVLAIEEGVCGHAYVLLVRLESAKLLCAEALLVGCT
jgi:hypothetical protein